MTFNNVKTCPLKISLYGATVRSAQLVNVGWWRSLTVALGSSVVQFMVIFIPSKAEMAGAGGLTNFSALVPAEKQMNNSIMYKQRDDNQGLSFSAYKSNLQIRRLWLKEVTPNQNTVKL